VGVGAGVVGLAVARWRVKDLKRSSWSMPNTFGMMSSARNSEVIHAGIYHPQGTLKTRLCVAGNRMLYEYAMTHQVRFNPDFPLAFHF
jgi:L-2-hydroxyglutarate oxidase LhgO